MLQVAAVVDALRGLLNAMHTVAAVRLMIDPRDLGRTLGDRDEPEAPPSSKSGPGFDPTLFLFDAVPGGVGLAARLFDAREVLLAQARGVIERCPCVQGCPACIGPTVGEEEAGKNRKVIIGELLDQLEIGALDV